MRALKIISLISATGIAVSIFALLVLQFVFGVDVYTTLEVSSLIKRAIYFVIAPGSALLYWMVFFRTSRDGRVGMRSRLKEKYPNSWVLIGVFNGLLVAGVIAFLLHYGAAVAVQYVSGSEELWKAELVEFRPNSGPARRGRRNRCDVYAVLRYNDRRESQICFARTRTDSGDEPLSRDELVVGQSVNVRVRINFLGVVVEEIFQVS